MDPEIQAIQEDIRALANGPLKEVRDILTAKPWESTAKDSEKRIIDDLVPKLVERQGEQMKKQFEAEAEAMQRKVDEAVTKLARAAGMGGSDDHARKEFEAEWRGCMVTYIASGCDLNHPDVRSFVAKAEAARVTEAESRKAEGRLARAQSVSVATEGGLLVPPGLMLPLRMKYSTRINPIEAVATRFQLDPGTDTYFAPFIASDIESDDPAAETTEAGLPTAANVDFELLQRSVNPVRVYITNVTDKFLRKVANAEEILTQYAAKGIAYKRSKRYLHGTNAGQPEGLMVTSRISDVTGFDTSGHNVHPNDFYLLQTAMKAEYRANARFAFNSNTLGSILTFRDESGGAGTGQYLLPVSFRDGIGDIVAGKPYLICETMQDDGTDDYLPVLFGDFEQYAIADDGSTRIYRDAASTMPKVRLLWEEDYDGCVLVGEAFKRLKV